MKSQNITLQTMLQKKAKKKQEKSQNISEAKFQCRPKYKKIPAITDERMKENWKPLLTSLHRI